MINVLLFEDNKNDVAQLKASLPKNEFEIVGISSNLKDGVQQINQLDYDIAIIDIFMGDKPEGIEFANEINNSTKQKPFIFLTSSIEQHIFKNAKNTQPFNYLIKPFNKFELLFSIELAIEKFSEQQGAFAEKKTVFCNDCFFVKKNNSLIKITFDRIFYVTVDGQYCKMITESGNFILQISLTQILKDLPPEKFIKTHRNYVINLNMVDSIYPNDNLLILKNKDKVLLSRRLQSDFFSKYRIFK